MGIIREEHPNLIKGRRNDRSSHSTTSRQRVNMSSTNVNNKPTNDATIEMSSNGQEDYNLEPDSSAPVRPADDLEDLLEEIIAKPPPQLEVIHDYENILTTLVTRMIILTDISETQELLASASAYFLKMLEENSQTT